MLMLVMARRRLFKRKKKLGFGIIGLPSSANYIQAQTGLTLYTQSGLPLEIQ